MKSLGPPISKNVKNAWGNYSDVITQDFMIETEDVGRMIPNLNGFGQPDYKITTQDLGKIVSRMWDGKGWECRSLT